jgi:hypothetical protein
MSTPCCSYAIRTWSHATASVAGTFTVALLIDMEETRWYAGDG